MSSRYSVWNQKKSNPINFCGGCQFESRCETEKLACKEFKSWVYGGVMKRSSEPKPNRRIYKEMDEA